MPRSGSSYSLPVSSWYPAVADTLIAPEDSNSTLQDIAVALTNSVSRDGAGQMSGDLDLGGNKVVNLGQATANGQAMRFQDTQQATANGSAFGALTFSADTYFYATGASTFAIATITAYGRSLIAVASEAAFKALVNLEPNVDYQPYAANLTTWAGLTPSGFATLSGSETLTNKTIVGGTSTSRGVVSSETSGALTAANSANHVVNVSGNISIDPGGFTSPDFMILICDGTDRTITRTAGAMYVNGTDSATATLSARQIAVVHFSSSSAFELGGAVS